MAFETLTDMIQSIYEVGHAKQAELVTSDMLNRLRAAQGNDNRSMMADILGECFNQVAEKTAPMFRLKNIDRNTFGAKLGWLANNEGMSDRERLEFLAGYKRDIAQPALEQAVQLGFRQGLVKSVIRSPVGETCDWCLARCGTYEYNYGSATGIFARHKGCDDDITIRWLDPDKIDEGVEVDSTEGADNG